MAITILNLLSLFLIRALALIPHSGFLIQNSLRTTLVESPLQIHLFMQNEPILQNMKINLTLYPIKHYNNLHHLAEVKTNPIQTHFSATQNDTTRNEVDGPVLFRSLLSLQNYEKEYLLGELKNNSGIAHAISAWI
ncbi:MAG: hypothetical protein FVQ80_02135 [Planctomycetes bacterium]|nr:hypothetical protein [Planctomycetota bacterium]